MRSSSDNCRSLFRSQIRITIFAIPMNIEFRMCVSQITENVRINLRTTVVEQYLGTITYACVRIYSFIDVPNEYSCSHITNKTHLRKYTAVYVWCDVMWVGGVVCILHAVRCLLADYWLYSLWIVKYTPNSTARIYEYGCR